MLYSIPCAPATSMDCVRLLGLSGVCGENVESRSTVGLAADWSIGEDQRPKICEWSRLPTSPTVPHLFWRHRERLPTSPNNRHSFTPSGKASSDRSSVAERRDLPLGLCAWCVLGDLRSLQTQSTHQTFLTEEEDVNAFLKRPEAAKKGGVFRGNRAVSAATLFGR
jgi:hypothetical protein